MNELTIGPFRGAITSLDGRHIPDGFSSSQRNVSCENGDIAVRYGYRNLQAAQSGFTAGYGLVYLSGIDSNDAPIEEYISFEHLGASVAAYPRNASTLAAGSALTGATGLNASHWMGFPWDNTSYFVNPNEASSIKKHTIGDATSWKTVGVPSAPTTDISYVVTLGGQNTAYSQLSFAGIDPTNASEMACTGGASNTGSSLNTDNSILVNHSARGAASVEIDLSTGSAGDQDWYWNDCFAIQLTTVDGGPFKITPGSIQIQFTNNNGSPVTLIPDRIEQLAVSAWTHNVYLYFNNKIRADWGNGTGTGEVRKIKISYVTESPGVIQNSPHVTIHKMWVGAVQLYDHWQPSILPNYSSNVGLVLGYSYHDGTADFESGIGGVISIPKSSIAGYDPLGLGFYTLGTWVQVTFTVSSNSDVTNYRFYTWGMDSLWHRVVTQADSTHTYTYRLTREEADALDTFLTSPFQVSGCVYGFPFKGWVTWLYKDGYVRDSRVGEPEKLASDLDVAEDENRGRTRNLAPDIGDVPVCGFQAGDAQIIFGSQAAYGSVGDRPFNMTPFKRLPGSFGVANLFGACRYWDESGVPGVAYLAKNGEGVYFVSESAVAALSEAGHAPPLVELTAGVRNELRDFLLTPQSLTDFSTARMDVDPNTGALWLIVGARAMVLRRPSIIDGQRGWEFYIFGVDGTETIKYLAFSTTRRMRWFRSNGKVDENEYHSSNNAFIDGTSRDGGNPIPPSTIYWQSKVFTLPNSRIHYLEREADDYRDTPSATIVSSRQTDSGTWESERRNLKFGALQQGRNHSVRVVLEEGQKPISRLIVKYSQIGKGYNR